LMKRLAAFLAAPPVTADTDKKKKKAAK
jgi:hypothetical protein